MSEIPYGYCHCGCGAETNRAPRNYTYAGIRKGDPAKYLPHHHNRRSAVDFTEDEGTHCWVWQRSQNGRGYGKLYREGVLLYAHRVFYEELVGPIPEGLVIDHLCKNPACVNPGHLEPVTQRENVMRGESFSAVNARKTHCPKGHSYSGDNVRVSGWGRACRTCDREAQRVKA